jgi:beta-glucanase (GH16 family)
MEMTMTLRKKKRLQKALMIFGLLSFFHVPVFSQIFIQAEDFVDMEGVANEGCADYGGGLNVGWIDAEEWMEYDVVIPVTGEYELNVRAASLNGGSILTINNNNNSSDITINATGGWQNWQAFNGALISLEEGLQRIRLTTSTGGFNLNWFELRLNNPDDTDKPTTPVIIDSSSDVHTVSLNWNKSNDTTSIISGYKILNNGNFLAFANDTLFELIKLAPETEFSLEVYACDLTGNQSSPATASISTTAINWKLAWSDEFEGTEVDRSKWNFEVGGDGWGNGEAQYYTDGDNSRVEDGCLIIEARKENVGSNQYTSSRMNNGGKGSFVYGRAEIRAKLPSTGGTWPAIWTLPTEWIYGNWPDCGEIDIMEHRGNYLNYVFGTIHTGAYNHVAGTAQSGGKMFDDVVNTFHTYTLEWYPDHLDWYYDDEIVFTFTNEYKSFAEWPYDIKHHIMLNVAIGGGLGGEINHNGVWPQQMIVDYVRIYDFNLGEGDTIPPSNPSNLQAEVSGINIDLSWDIATDNEYIKWYYIYKNEELIDSVSGSMHTIKYLEPTTEYTFSIQAKDFGGNYSEKISINATTGEIESFAIPGKFEAEDYLYMEGMQEESCTDDGGGVNMAYINTGDWLEYNINVQNQGKYYLVTRAASQTSVGNFELLNENQNVLTTVETPKTGGWQNWETIVSEGFQLNQGEQRIRINALANDFNINWFAITTDSSEYATSINSVLINNDIIFPNPSNGNDIYITLGKANNIVNVDIYTLEGKTLYRKDFENSERNIHISNLNLESGVYLINITKDGLKSSYKLLIR